MINLIDKSRTRAPLLREPVTDDVGLGDNHLREKTGETTAERKATEADRLGVFQRTTDRTSLNVAARAESGAPETQTPDT